MGLINTIGYFKGFIVDGALGQSSGGLPQEVWALKATEIYDEENQEYLPVDDEHDEITAYLILMSYKDKETKTAQQVKKITGWDGASFVDLHGVDLIDMPLSWRVEENTYEGNTTLQVSWVAEHDASPTRTVSKISKEDAQALQARYASILASTKAPVKAVSAKTAAVGKSGAKKFSKLDKPSTRPKPKAPAKPRAPRKKVALKPPKTTVGKCTADDAYNACYELKRDDVTEDALNDLWQTTVAAVNVDEAKITEEQWYEIKETILKQVSKVG